MTARLRIALGWPFTLLLLATACAGEEESREAGNGTGAASGAGGQSEGARGGAAGRAGAGSAGLGGSAAGEGGVAFAAGGAPSEGGAGGAAGEDEPFAGGAGAFAGEGGGEAPGGAGRGEGGEGGASEPDPFGFVVDVKLASDVDPAAPGTIGIVTFSLEAPPLVRARVEFGLDDAYGMTAPVDLAEPGYRTLLLGMKPDRTYHFRVVAEDADATRTSADYTLRTGPPSTVVPLGSFNVIDDARRERGFLVASYWTGPGARYPFILDADGEIVWWAETPLSTVSRARMSADGKNMWLVPTSNTGGPLVRVRMDRLELQQYDDAIGSHDITEVEGETMAFLEYGEDDCDSIYEIEPNGALREIFESQGNVPSDGTILSCHGNALRYSRAEGLFTFSEWRYDILAIDRQGAIVWQLGERVTGGSEAWGGVQHGHQLLADRMVVFGNVAARGGDPGSQVVEYSLAGQELGRLPSYGLTANLGDVQRLPGGNTLVTYSNASLIQEVDGEGVPVLEIQGGEGSRFGYVTWRESLYGPSPDSSD